MADEAGLWSWLKAGLPGSAHANRVENLSMRAMPDIEMCVMGSQVWIETKVLSAMNKDGTRGRLHFEPGQREWAFTRWASGGSAFVLIGVPISGRSEAIGRVFLIPGHLAMTLPSDGTLDVRQLERRCILTYCMGRSLNVPLMDPHTRTTFYQIVASVGALRGLTQSVYNGLETDEKIILRTPADQTLAEMRGEPTHI